MPNAFEIFNLPPAVHLDQAALHQRYIQLSAANHPDRFIDPLDQADAANLSSQINSAYQTLADFISRSELLVSLWAATPPTPQQAKALPPDLLINMMELREQMEEAQSQKNQAGIAHLHTQAHDRKQAYEKTIADLLQQAAPMPVSPARDALLQQARQALNAWRYFNRMIEQTTLVSTKK